MDIAFQYKSIFAVCIDFSALVNNLPNFIIMSVNFIIMSVKVGEPGMMQEYLLIELYIVQKVWQLMLSNGHQE